MHMKPILPTKAANRPERRLRSDIACRRFPSIRRPDLSTFRTECSATTHPNGGRVSSGGLSERPRSPKGEDLESEGLQSWRARRQVPSGVLEQHPPLLVHRTTPQSHAFSGNNPGIQREARAAGNARRKGARVLSETMTPLRMSAETMRLALRSLVEKIAGVSARGISPR